MNPDIINLPIPATDDTAGTSAEVSVYREVTAYCHQPSTGGATFSLKIQAKVSSSNLTDGTCNDDWIDLVGSSGSQTFTAPGLSLLTGDGLPAVTHLRVYRTSIADTGTPPSVTLACRRR